MKRKTIKEFALIITGIALFIVALLFFDSERTINRLLSENENAFQVFGITLVGLVFITGILYQRTLDCVDNETPATVRVLVVNIVVWCIFWICWSGYNAMILMHYPVTIKLLLFSVLLATIPGLSFFIFTIGYRKEELASRSLKYTGATPAEIGLYEKLLALPYYTGFYGLLTVPVYAIVLLVLVLF